MAQPRANNFTLLRLAAASTVFACHSVLLRHSASVPVTTLVGIAEETSAQAVNAFFVMSGFMILQSLERDCDGLRFLRNRILRIFPGLIVCILATAFLLGPLLSTLSPPKYFAATGLRTFLIQSSTLVAVSWNNLFLPGVFETNPAFADVNSSLWTLRYELLCYAAFGTLAVLGGLTGQRRKLIVFATLFLCYAAVSIAVRASPPAENLANDIRRFGFCFLIGATYAAIVPFFRLRAWHVSLALLLGAVSPFMPMHETLRIISVAALVLWLAYLPVGGGYPFTQMPDYSYGVYIYACPIQQAVISITPGFGWFAQAAVSLLCVAPIAALSWYFIEKPALALKASGRSIWTSEPEHEVVG